MSEFRTELLFDPSPVPGYFDLTGELRYFSDALGKEIVIESGFRTNFVTGRKLLVVRRIVQDKMNRAAVVHDKCYETGMVPRSMADSIFREAMLVDGVASWRAWAAWAAVRACGWQFYNQASEGQAA